MRTRKNIFYGLTIAVCSFLLSTMTFSQDISKDQIEKTLRKAVAFYRDNVSTEGGYLWKYSADLTLREGENIADDQTVWVQPPGTPTIGLVMLRAYQTTGDRYYLEAAIEAGHCLVRGQLESGGWTYPIHFDPEKRKGFRYRTNAGTQSSKAKNVSTLDDNTTQSALFFLMELDAALKFNDAAVHEAVQYGLAKLLEAQFPNGAFAQGFWDEPRNAAEHPNVKASFPPEGTEPTHEKEYWKFYTFNDGLALDANRVFFAAAEIYGTEQDGKIIPNEKYVAAARKLGDFMIAAQMPEPQPAWAQQYDFNVRPAWARRFEPASITGGESQGVINALIDLYRFTGDKKYLQPIPAAIDYLERSRLPDGRLARFYEMRTNKPLYMTKEYELTYSDDDVPTHYSFKVGLSSWPIDQLLEMDEPTRLRQQESFRERYRNRALPKPNAQKVAEVIRTQDERGVWLTEGVLKSAPNEKSLPIIDNQVFVKNIDILLGELRNRQ